MKTRKEISREECNVDPIFLLQVRRVMGVSEEFRDEVEYDHDAESYRYKGRKVKEKFMLEHDMLLTYWHTESVWMYREEADAEAKRRDYYYGKRWENHRVYCVAARGLLVKTLEESELALAPSKTTEPPSEAAAV